MPEQVEGDVAERDVLFEFGGAGDPPAELLREDQRVVAQPERVLGDVGGCRRAAASAPASSSASRSSSTVTSPCGSIVVEGHRCGTPSEAV